MDKYLKMFKPAMTKWLLDHYPIEEAKKRWKKTVYLDGKWIRHKTLAYGDGECNYWILGDKDPNALADVGSK